MAWISFDRTTIGHVLARLETKQLIVRRGGMLDKRTKMIRLTLKGESLIREVSKRVDEIGEIILKPFNPDERTALLKLLAKSAQSVDEQGEQCRLPSDGAEEAVFPAQSLSVRRPQFASRRYRLGRDEAAAQAQTSA